MKETKRFYAVHLHGSPSPTRVFSTKFEAINWGVDRDLDCYIQRTRIWKCLFKI